MITLPPRPRPVAPLTVDPGSIRSTGASLLAASAQVDDLGTFVAGSARVGDWHGRASGRYHADIAPLGERADAMSLALRGVARRVDAHAEEMQGLVRTRDDLDAWRARLDADIDQLRADVAGATVDDEPRLQRECDRVAGVVRQFESDLSTWENDVRTEETAMVDAFSRVMSVEDVERRYGGVDDPADEALDSKPPAGASPEAVHDWWVGLTRAQRDAIIAAAPGAVGNLDGIPAADRDAANTVRLDRDIADWEHTEDEGVLTGDEEQWLENARAARDALEDMGERTDPVTGEPVPTQLYLYDPGAFGGDGRIGIAAGDLDTADNVAVVTPGLGTDATSIGTQGDRAATIYESSRYLDPDASNATLAWIGYDAPDNIPFLDGPGADAAGVVKEDLAEDGGRRLADAVDGLRATRPDDPAHLTVIGHSHGSTTVGHGAHDEGLAADDIVVVGSPGLGGDTNNAGDLNIDPDHVWAGADHRDPVADLGNHGWVHLETFGGLGLGDDPVEDDFGAHRFQAESTEDHGNPFGYHSDYFDHDSESLANISHVVNGQYDDVAEAGHVHDPWWRGPQDPEADRDAHHVPTRSP